MAKTWRGHGTGAPRSAAATGAGWASAARRGPLAEFRPPLQQPERISREPPGAGRADVNHPAIHHDVRAAAHVRHLHVLSCPVVILLAMLLLATVRHDSTIKQ